mmetsp:Transcript_12723/g.26813  ORF Transcript_12723/g.26813 Transcript_12723/m.26813 type:complete len:99 (+) Transcript_12723:1944-2240(+)
MSTRSKEPYWLTHKRIDNNIKSQVQAEYFGNFYSVSEITRNFLQMLHTPARTTVVPFPDQNAKDRYAFYPHQQKHGLYLVVFWGAVPLQQLQPHEQSR